MQILLVANNPNNWPLDVPGVSVVAARKYLTDPQYSQMRNVRVFNVCRSYSYQSLGYYVSLLAEARGHKPTPDVMTIQDMKSVSLVRVITDDLDRVIQKSLKSVNGNEFDLSIYFGRTLAKRDRGLGLRLFSLFRAPLLRAHFVRKRDKWSLQSIRPISTGDVPDRHREDLIEAAKRFLQRGNWAGASTRSPRYYLAILSDPNDKQTASNPGAIEKFIRAARKRDVGTEIITRDDFERLGEFDALFIRTTTFMNHYTYRFSRRAAADGLAVIDDPLSIARCTNKVFLTERLLAAGVPIPPTMIVHKDNAEQVPEQLGLPVVLKQPDSAFSLGVCKAGDLEEFQIESQRLLKDSDLILAQSFVKTAYDWRIGVLAGEALYACKYFMARNHWQIYNHADDATSSEGNASTIPIDQAPKKVVQAAVKAAKLMGDGLYGVDLKEIDGNVFVIEVNDNPSIDAGVEDRVLKDQLYDRIIEYFIQQIERLRGDGPRDTRASFKSKSSSTVESV